MTDIEWKSPPLPQPQKADLVAQQLRTKPGEWALIDKHDGIAILPWWHALHLAGDYEVRNVNLGRRLDFTGPREVYARYIGEKRTDD